MSNSKNDIAWYKIFEDFPIVNVIEEKGFFIITSSQINKYREARLMTKFDVRRQLPKVFIKNGLAILPVTRGSYIIGKFNIFED
ncbi:type II restriction enzyme, partial [Psychrobacter namhaensis]|uniref:type II restriction enzyme n=1 Tax=Psychrobacter namhaensis TaxID=292734 RepID=UPI003FD379B0